MRLERNRIYQGDALELIDQVDDNSIDLIVSDGPYGVAQHAWDRVGEIQAVNLGLVKELIIAGMLGYWYLAINLTAPKNNSIRGYPASEARRQTSLLRHFPPA